MPFRVKAVPSIPSTMSDSLRASLADSVAAKPLGALHSPTINKTQFTAAMFLFSGAASKGSATILAAAFQDEHPVVAVSWVARRIELVHSCRGLLADRRGPSGSWVEPRERRIAPTQPIQPHGE